LAKGEALMSIDLGEIIYSLIFIFWSIVLNIAVFDKCYQFLDEDLFAEESDMPGNIFWIGLCFLIPIWITYNTWGTLLDEGFLYLIRAVLGTTAISIAPMIIFFIIFGIFGYFSDLSTKQKKNLLNTFQSYQILIGAILIALAIIFVAW
jgi:hypothetical protein